MSNRNHKSKQVTNRPNKQHDESQNSVNHKEPQGKKTATDPESNNKIPHEEASRKAAERRRQHNKNEWRRALRLFWLKNRTILTIVLAVFIVVEGSVVWFYPAQWWKPVLAVSSVSAVLILWRNMKAVFKGVISLAVAVMMAALAVQSGFSYGGMNTAALWGMAVLTGWAVTVLVSYIAHPMTSRWTIALVSAAVGFMMGYTFMPLGMVAIGVSSILGALFMEFVFLVGEALRRKMSVFKPAKEWQIKEYGRLQKAMKSLWPGMKSAGIKILGTWSTTVWYGLNCPTVVMIPVDLEESFVDSKRRGITYRHRNIQPMAVWMIMKVIRIVRSPAPVVVFVDQNGINEASSKSAETMGFKINDSMNYVYAGVLDGSVTSVSALRKTITALVKRFDGLEYADQKQVDKLDRDVSREWTRQLAKMMKQHVVSAKGSSDETLKNGEPKKITESKTSIVFKIFNGESAPSESVKITDVHGETPVELDRNGNEVHEDPLSKETEKALKEALDKMDL